MTTDTLVTILVVAQILTLVLQLVLYDYTRTVRTEQKVLADQIDYLRQEVYRQQPTTQPTDNLYGMRRRDYEGEGDSRS